MPLTANNVNAIACGIWPTTGWKPICKKPECDPGGTGVPTAVAQTNHASPSLSGNSMKFSITGPAYTNALWAYMAGSDETALVFDCDYQLYVTGASYALAQALEIDVFKFSTVDNKRYMMGTQWNRVQGCWQIWDGVSGWINTPVTTAPSQDAWTHIQQRAHLVPGDINHIYYDYIVIGGTTHWYSGTPNVSVAKLNEALPAGWASVVGIQWQIDIAAAGSGGSPVEMLIDNALFATAVSVPDSAPAPTASISADPSAIAPGESSTLTWTTTDAVAVWLSGVGMVATSGSITVPLAVTTTYVLTASGAGGTAQSSVEVIVNPGGGGGGGGGDNPCAILGGGISVSDIDLNIAPTTQLYKSFLSPSAIQTSISEAEGRTAIVLDFNSGEALFSRDLGTVFAWSLQAANVLRVWQPSMLAMPEGIYSRPGEWDNGGYAGAKFIQGVIVEADSFGASKTFALQSSDDGSTYPLLEMPKTFARQSDVAFSCVPFVAHSVRLVSTDGVAWRVWGSKLVFQPYPEMTMNWTAPMSSLGLTGWGHLRECNIAHISTADLALKFSFDLLPPITITIPHSGGNMQKVKITLPANKFKLVKPSITSTAPFRLFAPDLEVKVKQWGSSDPYAVVKPFGGASNVGAEV